MLHITIGRYFFSFLAEALYKVNLSPMMRVERDCHLGTGESGKMVLEGIV